MNPTTLQSNLTAIAERWAADRAARQLRRALDPADFDALRDAGFLLTGVPEAMGGVWRSAPESVRFIGGLLRTLAGGDSSVALVSAMHPVVLAFWNVTPDAPAPYTEAWDRQRRLVAQTALDDHWWGTIQSEPESGGDTTRTKTGARLVDATTGEYRTTGLKHFGSGSGVTSYMLTVAVPEGETLPDNFSMDVRGHAWDGSTGITLVAPWDSHAMPATQSHSFRYDDFPAIRFAWPNRPKAVAPTAFIACLFTSVIVGVVDVAMATARERLLARRGALRPYEQVEWTTAETEAWLIQQAYQGMLTAMERQPDPLHDVRLGKAAISQLAESVLLRLTRVMGGGTLSRRSPFGFWFEDVRALGFLRPPWGLAYDEIIADSLG